MYIKTPEQETRPEKSDIEITEKLNKVQTVYPRKPRLRCR